MNWKDKDVPAKKRHNTAFVVGSVIGGLAGAAAALWKTPYSGEELREKIAGGSGRSGTSGDTVKISTTGVRRQSMQDKVLSTVENRLAPIVGVKLGKTANGSGDVQTTSSSGYAGTTTRDHETPGAAPAFPDDEPLGYGDATEATEGAGANVTPVDRDGGAPSRMSSPTMSVPDEDAASIDQLTKPQIDLKPDAFKNDKGNMHPFPKLGGNKS